jgi:cysteinyl-tRNA synthetase
MAKAEENFLTLRRLIEEGYDPLDYRYFCLQSHYRKELAFDWEGLDAARTGLRRLKEKVLSLGADLGAVNKAYSERFNGAVSDDLNVAQGLSVAWELVDDAEVADADKLATIKKMDAVLGLKLDEPIEFELPPQITKWILERNEARDKKDWKKADEIRNKIETSGKWMVKDGLGGTEVRPK